MVMPVQCEACGLSFEVADEYAGRQVKCRCGNVVEVATDPSMIDLLSEELKEGTDPLLAETPEQWAKATGADPEIAARLEKRMASKLSGNSGFMMAITGIVVALMLIIGLIAFLMASGSQKDDALLRPADCSGAVTTDVYSVSETC